MRQVPATSKADTYWLEKFEIPSKVLKLYVHAQLSFLWIEIFITNSILHVWNDLKMCQTFLMFCGM